MPVKVIGFNGSPRKYGNTFKLLSIALNSARRHGAEVELIHLGDLTIKPCLGCLSDVQEACRYPCVIDDDMKEIYDKVLSANAIIIATPIYWYQPSGLVKNFVDRLTALENMIWISGRSWVEGKVAGVLAVGNDSGEMLVVSALTTTLITMGFVIPPFAIACFNENRDVLEDESTVLDAMNVGRSVALMAELMKKFKAEKWFSPDLLSRMRDVVEFSRRKALENMELQRTSRDSIVRKLLSR